MPEADAQDRELAGQLAHHGQADAGRLRAPGAGRDHHGVGLGPADGLDVDGVVAMDDRLGAKLPELLDEVVDERVVIVDDQHPGAHVRLRW